MKKQLLITLVASTLVLAFSWGSAYALSVFTSSQVGTGASNGYYLKTDGTNSTWASVSAGGGTISTSSPLTAGLLVQSTGWNQIANIATSSLYSGTTGQMPYFSGANTITATSSVFITPTGQVGIGTTSLGSSQFQVAESTASVSDNFGTQNYIASLSNVVESSNTLQLIQAICGSYTVTGLDGTQYGTVLGEDGKCWLSKNLGATEVATSYSDSASYGSLYQWGRSYDGHQGTAWDNVGTLSTVAPFSGVVTTATAVSTPNTSKFVATTTSPYDWLNNPVVASTLWQSSSSYQNNVCPSGWHVPTQLEWATWTNAAGLTTGAGSGSSGSTACGSTCDTAVANSKLKLPEAGYRSYSGGSLLSQGSGGNYWSGSPNGTSAYHLSFNATSVNPADNLSRAYGFSVRCIKN